MLNTVYQKRLYLEVGRPDIVAITKQQQYSFFKKLISLSPDEAVCRRIVSLHRNLPMLQYYDNIKSDVSTRNKEQKLNSMMSSVSTYHSRYRDLIDLKFNHVLYESCLPEALRIIITRWRLSNHKLRIETDRYTRPKPHRTMRVCRRCDVLEDESHAIYDCPIFASVRNRYVGHLQRYPTIKQILNPTNVEDATILGNVLLEIEKKIEQRELII